MPIFTCLILLVKLIKLGFKYSVLKQSNRLVWVLRRFEDSLIVGNKLYSSWVGMYV